MHINRDMVDSLDLFIADLLAKWVHCPFDSLHAILPLNLISKQFVVMPRAPANLQMQSFKYDNVYLNWNEWFFFIHIWKIRFNDLNTQSDVSHLRKWVKKFQFFIVSFATIKVRHVSTSAMFTFILCFYIWNAQKSQCALIGWFSL